MALTPGLTIVHLPFASPAAYASPLPEGLAVGHIDQIGDASGGSITASFLAVSGFLYRFELLNVTTDDETGADISFATHHTRLTDQSGLGSGAFSLNWQTVQHAAGGFSVFSPRTHDLVMIPRIPIGQTRPAAGQFVCVITVETNVDLTVYDFDVIFSYWPVTALKLSGFLPSFWEAPVVPVVLPGSRI